MISAAAKVTSHKALFTLIFCRLPTAALSISIQTGSDHGCNPVKQRHCGF
jgi:hypothetical protein